LALFRGGYADLASSPTGAPKAAVTIEIHELFDGRKGFLGCFDRHPGGGADPLHIRVEEVT